MMENLSLFPELPILFVSDDKQFKFHISQLLLQNEINHLEFCSNPVELIPFILKKQYSLVLLDAPADFISDNNILEEIKQEQPECKIIIFITVDNVEIVVQLSDQWASGIIKKDCTDTEFFELINKELEILDITQEIIPQWEGIIAVSQKMKDICNSIESFAATDLPILISGDIGTGKKLIARTIHHCSGRKGAFIEKKADQLDTSFLAEISHHTEPGTIFVDGIQKLSQEMQKELCLTIQNSNSSHVKCQFKIIDRFVFTSGPNIARIKEKRTFDDALYKLLESHRIKIPSLNDHKEDIRGLAIHLIKLTAEELKKTIPYVQEEMFRLLSGSSFPENITTLRKLIFEAMTNHQHGILSLQVFRERLFLEEFPRRLSHEINQGDKKVIFGKSLPTFSEMDIIYIRETLKRSCWDKKKAAVIAGKPEDDFYAQLTLIEQDSNTGYSITQAEVII